MKFNPFLAVLFVFGLAACDNTDRVVFVTSTELGIGADGTTGNVTIGYDRTEAVFGPGYPDTGALPPVYARLESNRSIWNPQVKQLYASGDAARMVSGGDAKNPKQKHKPLTGKRRLMVFGTATNIGLKVQFVNQIPSGLNIGYKRKEFSILSLQRNDPTNGKEDHYPSVIASIDMQLEASDINKTGLTLSQYIATGDAAENLAAKNGAIRKAFEQQSKEALALKNVEAIPLSQSAIETAKKPICDAYGAAEFNEKAAVNAVALADPALKMRIGSLCIKPAPTDAEIKAAARIMKSNGLIQ